MQSTNTLEHSLQEVVELLDSAVRPPEALRRVPEVGHDEAVLPPTFAGAGTAQVGGGWGSVMNSAKTVMN